MASTDFVEMGTEALEDSEIIIICSD